MTVNKVMLVGRLGADPEYKSINDKGVVNLNVATSEHFTVDGAKKEKTEWHRVVVWGKLADICNKYLTKGSQVFIEGKLRTRSWDDKNGVKRYTTEIVASTVQFLSTKGGDKSGSSSKDGGAGPSSAMFSEDDGQDTPTRRESLFGDDGDDGNDEIPF